MAAPKHLILFDVDGTLLDCGPQVRGIIEETLQEVFGRTGDVSRYDFVGKTDTQIVIELQREAGTSRAAVDSAMSRVRELYLEKLERGLETRDMRLLPGVLEILERLDRRPEVVLALLTGNWEGGARIKLSRFDLNRFFPFGAFGDGHENRRSLPPQAMSLAEEITGRRFAPTEAVIVGDSSLDVDCAQAHGLRSLAVATGKTPIETLDSTGADWVVSNLTEAVACAPPFAA